MKPLISIIIPTWNNEQFLNPCVYSILKTGVIQIGYAELIIINNGKQKIKEQYAEFKNIKVIDSDINLGWEGGLKEGIKHSSAPFLCFQNDDTFIPQTSTGFYEKLLVPFQDENVACVGPATTCAAGIQSIYNPAHPLMDVQANWLIFFTVMVRRSHLEEVGGIDDSLPGGDDLDLCMRFRKAGKKVVMSPNTFLIHHGFKTGTRVKGSAETDGGWNSQSMTENTNIALIRKHGFAFWFSMICRQAHDYELSGQEDCEGDIVRGLVKDGDKIVELGCGYRKTVPNSTGVDQMAKGETIPIRNGVVQTSDADIVADVTKPLPFEDGEFDTIIARHILEHCVDTFETLNNWKRVLRDGGNLIIAVPNQNIVNSIPLDPTHVHAFTPESLKNLVESLGFKQTSTQNSGNGISFISSFHKVPSTITHWNSNTKESVVCSE